MTDENKDTFETLAQNQLYQSAFGTVIVAGMFLLIVLSVLSYMFYQFTFADVERADQLLAMKKSLSEKGPDENLLSEIRQQDLKVRNDTIRHRVILIRGGFLFVGGLVVFFAGLKVACRFKKKILAPSSPHDIKDIQYKQASQARLAVTITLAVIGGAAVYMTLSKPVDFSKAESQQQAANPYATMDQINSNWASFRGPAGSGISPFANVPTKWDAVTGEGILWKSPIELPGHNSPVVWSDRIFITGADKTARHIYCYDAQTGNLLWKGAVSTTPGSAYDLDIMEDTGYAACTAVTDGKRVCAIFANGDIGCFDYQGDPLWLKNLGEPDSIYGYASSLAMYENLVIVQYDHGDGEDGKSKLIALDWLTGAIVWQKIRPVPNSWTSPIVAKVGEKYQIITCGSPLAIAYDPTNGNELWRAEAAGGDVAPSPVYCSGKAFFVEPYNRLVAINIQDAAGDITETNILWEVTDEIPDICSPLCTGQLIYLLTTEGMLTCYNVNDGSLAWEQEFKDTFFASPTLAGENVYLVNDKGTAIIFRDGTEYKEIIRCQLNESCYASPAFAEGRLYIRAKENLYCIGMGD